MTDKKHIPTPQVAQPEKRFPKAAADFVDTLLEVERLRFEQELDTANNARNKEKIWPARPKSALITADGDSFLGSGWGPMDRARKGPPRRWMAQVGAILLAADVSEGGRIQLKGGGFLKRRFVGGLTVWIDDWPVSGTAVTRGLNSWTFDGTVGGIPKRPYHILKLHAPGSRAFAGGPNGRGSIALSEIHFETF